MRIAVVTDDKKTISAHFGRARAFVVVTTENGRETGHETRVWEGGCQIHVPSHDHEHEREHNHGNEEHRYGSLNEMISDCRVVLARGMGAMNENNRPQKPLIKSPS